MVRYSRALSPALVGRRVMVRYAATGGAHTDAVGDLVAWRDGTLTVRTRRGEVRVAESALIAGKPVPEPRLLHAADASVAQLQRLSTRSWRPLETEWLGGWLLRAGGGFTGRANAVLPLGDPALPLDAALAATRQWYAARGLTARFQLPLPDAAGLDDALAARGWTAYNAAEVMVADVPAALAALPAPADLPAVRFDAAPTPGWLARYHYRGGTLPPVAVAVLTNHDAVTFASVVEDGQPLAIGRGAVDDDWLGVTAVEVAEHARRRGLARHLMRGLLAWAADRGAKHVQLQVAAGNRPAQELYAAAGFTPHHSYHYRAAPSGEA